MTGEDSGDEVFKFALDLRTLDRPIPRSDAAMPRDQPSKARDAQATLPPLDQLVRSIDDLRVDHDFGLHKRSIRIARIRP